MPEGLLFKIASDAERRAAVRLRATIYAKELGHVPEDAFDDTAVHIVACSPSGAVVAAFRLLLPEVRPFEFESSLDLAPMVKAGRRPAFLGRLCVSPDQRTIRRSLFIHSGLMAAALDIAEHKQLSDFYLYTFSHLIHFYQKAGFRLTGAIFQHTGYGQCMHIMHLEVRQVRECASASPHNSGSADSSR